MDIVSHENINAIAFITINKGAIRGNHYHKKTTQWNYILKGSIKYITQVADGPVEATILNTNL